jgi:hypothetical protein
MTTTIGDPVGAPSIVGERRDVDLGHRLVGTRAW